MGRDVSAALNAITAMTEQAEPWAMTPRLPEVQIPVVVLMGTAPHAGALSPEDIADLREGLENVEFRDVPGAGHFIYEEQPEAVAKAVADLISTLSVVGCRTTGAAGVPGGDGGTDLVKPADGR
jgi:pimeloyl-ACP methyl ester carboxylesterase